MTSKQSVVIVEPVRTAVGTFGGVAFDFATGKSLGPAVRLLGLNGQAVIFFG